VGCSGGEAEPNMYSKQYQSPGFDNGIKRFDMPERYKFQLYHPVAKRLVNTASARCLDLESTTQDNYWLLDEA
jgi:hypothetical protein